MKIYWSNSAWKEYLYWQNQDKKTLKKINQLIKELSRGSNKIFGKQEILKYTKGKSLRIDAKNRLVYEFIDKDILLILSCKDHYK